MANPWFRLYSKITTDPKVEYLAFEDQRHFVWILCYKNDGYLDEKFPSAHIREQMIARKLGLQAEAFTNLKERLLSIGLIDKNWQPLAWDDLQMHSDSSRERVRKYRARQKAAQPKPVTVTLPTVTVTAQDKEKDKDKEREREVGPALSGEYFGSRICPPDFTPDPEMMSFAQFDESLDLENELYKFKHHEFAMPKTDWPRCWLKWIFNAKPERNANGPNHQRNSANRLESWTKDALAGIEEGQGGDGGTSSAVAKYTG